MRTTVFSFNRKELFVAVYDDAGCYTIEHRDGIDDELISIASHSLGAAMSIARTLIEEGEVH